jgi:TetR/AcrR family transcriptional regulator
MNTQSRKEHEKNARRNEILEAGLQLFAEKDFHEVTVDEIAERVGLSKGTLYLYFKNKDDLFFSIIQEKTDMLYQRLNATIEGDKPFTELLKNFVYTFLTFFEEHKPYFKIVHSERSRADTNDHYRLHQIGMKFFQMFIDIIDDLIKIGQRQKIVRGIESSVLTKGLRGILNSFTFQRVFQGNSESIEKETEQILDLFLNGVMIK